MAHAERLREQLTSRATPAPPFTDEWLIRKAAEEEGHSVDAGATSAPDDEEEVPHAFNSRTRYESGDDRDIWCKDCEYHRDHKIHAGATSAPQETQP